MAFTFIQETKKQKYLLIVFLVVAVLLGGVLWFWLFQKVPSGITELTTSLPPRKIPIDFGILRNPIFQELEEPGPPIPFPEIVGKENPFLQVQ